MLDARKAVPVTLSTPRPSESAYRRLQWFHDSGIGGDHATFFSSYAADPAVTSIYAAPTGAVDGGRYDFAVRWHADQTPLTLRADGPGGRHLDLDAQYVTGSDRLDGTVRLSAVAVGAGAASDYPARGVRGKAVVVTRDDTDLATQVQTARDAGAALVVLVGSTALPTNVWLFGSGVPVVTVPPTAAASLTALTARGAVTLRGTAHATADYAYAVTKSWTQIPRRIAVAPTAKTLATVTSSLYDTSRRIAAVGVLDCRDYQFPPCVGYYTERPTGGRQTLYVSTEATNTWYSEAIHVDGWEQRGEQRTYAPRSRTAENWFAPVTSAHTGPSYWPSNRQGPFLSMNVAPEGGPGIVTGARYDTATTTSLYLGSTLLKSFEGDQSVNAEAPPATGLRTFRLVQESTASDLWRWSTRQHTEWTFRADTSEESEVAVTLPLVQLGYDVRTDLAGTVRKGSLVPLRVTAATQAGAAHAGKVTSASIAVSYDDGKTWRTLPALHRGGEWTTLLVTPRKGATAVSLKVSAKDSAGNAVEQQITRAFGLR